MQSEQQVVSYSGVVGWALQQKRNERGLSQAAVGAHLGVSQPTWAKIEKGIIPIQVIQLAQFAELVQTRLSSIFDDVDHTITMLDQQGTVVIYERSPTQAEAGQGNWVLGAALGSLVMAALMHRGD